MSGSREIGQARETVRPHFSLYAPELLAGDYEPCIEAYYYTQWDGFRMPFHAHNRAEIMYVISGQCEVYTEREKVALRKGELIVLDAGVTHRLLVEQGQPCRMLNVEFLFVEGGDAAPGPGAARPRLPFLRDLAAGEPALAALLAGGEPYLLLKDPNDVPHTLRSLVQQLDSAGPGRELMVQLLFAQLLLQVARLAAEARENGPEAGGHYVRQAIRYIHQHYDGELQVKDVAAAVSVHPGYLHRIFKRQTGASVLDYVTAYRIDKAKMLLAKSDVPIGDIADYIGLNSRQYFSAVFKKRTGLTPQEYRRQAARSARWPEPSEG